MVAAFNEKGMVTITIFHVIVYHINGLIASVNFTNLRS